MSDGCATKIAFLLDYSAAANAYSDAVLRLHNRAGSVQRSEYDELFNITEEARGRTESVRLAMEQHISSHGC